MTPVKNLSLAFILLLLLLLQGCSDEKTDSMQTTQLVQPEQEQVLAMPLNTPISEVVTNDTKEDVGSDADIAKDSPAANVKELEWDDLMPKDYRIEELLEQINAGELSDDDPRIDEAMQKVEEMFSKAPVVEELDNTMVKIPGFVVPLNPDSEEGSDFLLVPYYGACIHVPPPPANQTVFVTGPKSKYKTFDTVWVTGKLMVERSENDLGDSGYSIKATDIRPYE